MSMGEFVAIAAVFVLILILGLRFLSLYAGRSAAGAGQLQRPAQGPDRGRDQAGRVAGCHPDPDRAHVDADPRAGPHWLPVTRWPTVCST